ncbi:MAG: hypothetical protein CM15mP120_15420 [Pseudomonadota bacterium]|nr:MAG: hypothetical protein CM15mP120_15420 [Pseudomonadota bacterium]
MIAEAALAAIKVEYEPLAPVLDVLHAMQSDAPLVDENNYTNLPEKPRVRAMWRIRVGWNVATWKRVCGC